VQAIIQLRVRIFIPFQQQQVVLQFLESMCIFLGVQAPMATVGLVVVEALSQDFIHVLLAQN
jgi:hypothetical protein